MVTLANFMAQVITQTHILDIISIILVFTHCHAFIIAITTNPTTIGLTATMVGKQSHSVDGIDNNPHSSYRVALPR